MIGNFCFDIFLTFKYMRYNKKEAHICKLINIVITSNSSLIIFQTLAYLLPTTIVLYTLYDFLLNFYPNDNVFVKTKFKNQK
jgi:hypothetical protein